MQTHVRAWLLAILFVILLVGGFLVIGRVL